MLTEKEKSLWMEVYEAGIRISVMEPWFHFSEKDLFIFEDATKKLQLFMIIIGESRGQCGFAIYQSINDYLLAKNRLLGDNRKNEPQFYLQNALIGLWGNRKEISKNNYELIKELEIPSRGNGGWLHFEKYQTGFVPTFPTQDDIIILKTGLQNLFMMLCSLKDGRIKPQFSTGKVMFRWYDSKKEMYNMTHTRMDLPSEPQYTPYTVTIPANQIREVKKHKSGLIFGIDWFYLKSAAKEQGKQFFPRVILIVDKNSGMIAHQSLLTPFDDQATLAISTVQYMINHSGGLPNEIRVCDKELKEYITPFCKLLGIKLTLTKSLPEITKARKLFDHI